MNVLSIRSHNIDQLYQAHILAGTTELYVHDCVLPMGLPNLPITLLKLNVINCGLRQLPDLPPNLYHLRCSKNNLTSLPKLPNSLWALDCDYNLLQRLPKLPKGLRGLSCLHNHIPFDAFPDTTHLFTLRCDHSEQQLLLRDHNRRCREMNERESSTLPKLSERRRILTKYEMFRKAKKYALDGPVYQETIEEMLTSHIS